VGGRCTCPRPIGQGKTNRALQEPLNQRAAGNRGNSRAEIADDRRHSQDGDRTDTELGRIQNVDTALAKEVVWMTETSD
jgi:hypothetical protein